MSVSDLKGILPPMTTPFDKNGRIQLDLIKPQVDFLIGAGVDGIVAGGSGGEGHTLDPQEFKDLMHAVVEAIGGRVPFVSGIIVNSTAEAIARAHLVEDLEITALQVTPVHYLFQPSEAETYEHFKAVGDATDLPILIYNVIPWNYLSPTQLLDLMARIPNVVGVKQSAGDLKLLADLIENARPEDMIFTAIDALLYPSYALGARGCISALLTAVPHSNVALWDAVQAGNHPRALEIHKAQLQLWNAMPHSKLPACVKASLDMQGVEGGFSRMPMSSPDAEQKAQIRSALKGLSEVVEGVKVVA
jgi:4-hydroxy-tetrahydrodipicolinate synthase